MILWTKIATSYENEFVGKVGDKGIASFLWRRCLGSFSNWTTSEIRVTDKRWYFLVRKQVLINLNCVGITHIKTSVVYIFRLSGSSVKLNQIVIECCSVFPVKDRAYICWRTRRLLYWLLNLDMCKGRLNRLLMASGAEEVSLSFFFQSKRASVDTFFRVSKGSLWEKAAYLEIIHGLLHSLIYCLKACNLLWKSYVMLLWSVYLRIKWLCFCSLAGDWLSLSFFGGPKICNLICLDFLSFLNSLHIECISLIVSLKSLHLVFLNF